MHVFIRFAAPMLSYFPAYVRPFNSLRIPGGDSVLAKICLLSSAIALLERLSSPSLNNAFLDYKESAGGFGSVSNWQTLVEMVGHCRKLQKLKAYFIVNQVAKRLGKRMQP